MPRDRVEALEEELSGLEAAMAGLQLAYEARAAELQRLRMLRVRLETYRLASPASLTWAKVCRSLGWPVGRSAHASVKRNDPALHTLLHGCVFDPYCTLDRVSYAA